MKPCHEWAKFLKIRTYRTPNYFSDCIRLQGGIIRGIRTDQPGCVLSKISIRQVPIRVMTAQEEFVPGPQKYIAHLSFAGYHFQALYPGKMSFWARFRNSSLGEGSKMRLSKRHLCNLGLKSQIMAIENHASRMASILLTDSIPRSTLASVSFLQSY
jgi:hypothetical protein